jgi:4-amino-4-deoxy-L-arabinose transferase-like glycosyltransferase
MPAICLLAFALRLGPLYDNRFHPDEALYSTWSLSIARGENPLLTGVPIDKPPLLIYLNAISFYVFGQSELAARVPNLLASVVSVVLVWRLGISRLGTGRLVIGQSVTSQPVDPLTNVPIDQFTSLLPPLLFALSPFAISFAPTAFLDPMMIMFGLASLIAASRGRSGWAGVLLGLSFATKVQGLFFAPLLLVFSRQGNRETNRFAAPSFHHSISPSLRLAFGFVSVALLVLAWDRARGGLPFWQQQTINYGDIRLAYASEIGPRLIGWLSFLPYFLGPIVGVIGLIGLPRLLRASPRDRLLLSWLLAMLALHWLFDFPIWDRYVLLLVPVAALLIGRAIGHFVTLSPLHRVSPSLILAIAAIIALPFSAAAAESQYPIGGDHGANDGIDQVAVFLKTLPSGTVLYDHWLAWELGYYVGGGFVYVSYFDTPAALQDDLRVFGGAQRYVIFPGHESPAPVDAAIGEVGYTLSPVFTTQNRFGQTSFVVFKIVPR